MIRSNDEAGTPPGTPRRRSRRGGRRSRRDRRQRIARRTSFSSASSSSEDIRPKKMRKTKLSTKDILKLVKHVSKDKVSYNNFNNVVPEFDPSSGTQTIDCWIRKVNECAAIYDWDERHTVHFSLQKLSGLAKRWFEALPTVVFSWEEWQVKLRKAFPSEDNYGRLLEEMLGRTSRAEESFKEYFYDKLGLLTRCDIKGRKAVDCIVYGITDRSVRNGAHILNCSEPEDLLNYLSTQQPRNPYTKVSRDRFQSRPNLSKETSDTAVTCFNCRQKGHPFFKCPRALVKCKKCNRIGHNSELCTLRPFVSKFNVNVGDSTGEKRTMLIKSNDDSNTKYFKTIMINGNCLQAYIDFGSQCTLLRYSDAERLKLEKKFDKIPLLRGFGQSTVTPIYKSNACIRIDEIEANIDLLVVDDRHMPTSVIVGQNFTELPFITVLKDRHKLIFYKSPNFDIQDGSKNNVNLYVTEPTEVTATSAISVHSNKPYTGNLYIDGYIVLIPGKEYRLLHGIYDIREGKGQVVVANFSSHKLTLKENTLIARAVLVNDPKVYQVNLINHQELQPLCVEDIKTGSDLDNVQFNKLYSLLQKYRDCFATCLSELGCAKNVEMKIELTDRKPIVYRPYRLSHFEREQVRETINDLLQNDIIQESKSDYASPILMVKKKTGENRLCVDFRALNNKTLKDRFPLPIIEDQISSLSGNRFFTTLDLASGYYQIPMSKDSCHLTGFVTSEGHYEFKRMPFGLTNAPATFQRVINRILGNKRFDYARAYLDDILIPSKDIEEMFDRLEEILKLFRQNGLTFKLTKCSFFNTSVSYLGYEVSSEGIKPGETKVLAVKEFPSPSNVHEVRQFLGLTGYFRKFIKGYGEIARPLTSLLRKDSSWRWSNIEKQAFESLRDSLVARPILSLYNPELETEVHTDASAMGIGGILMQWQSEVRVLKPVAYFSRQTTPEEKYFHSYELETLAVVCTLKKFRVYLLGTHFKVFTDCAALRTTLTKRDLIPRIARWWLQISEYSFDINYRPGVQMSHVDALSRNSRLCPEKDEESTVVVYTIQKDNWLLSLQLADPEISKIFKILRPNDDPECRDIRQNYVIKDHTVYRKVDDKLCLVVPKSARWQICRANHDELGHFGYTKTLARIQTSYWFPKLRKFVKKYVNACLECAYNKDNASKQKTGFIHPIEKVPIPFHTIHIDHLGPFVKSRNGNTHILTVVDGFTKYVFIRAVRDLKTKSTVTVLQKIFFDFGVPARIISDRGTSFTSAAFQSFCTSHGIKHVLNAVACPRANGQAERFNQTILNSLAAQNSVDKEDNWDRCLGKIQWGINNTINTTTQKTATEAMFGVKLRDALSNKLNDNNNDTLSNIQDTRKEIATNIQKNQNHQKLRHDKNRIPATLYKINDLIKIARNNFDNNNKSTKLMSKFIGPYKITEVLGNDRYKITDIPGFNRKGKPYTTVIAADRIRPWVHIKTLELHESDKTSSDSDNSSD